MATNGASNGTVDHEKERKVQAEYWKEHSTGTVEAMMLDSNASEIDKLERPEVLGLLGCIKGRRVVELGAGIGRFTGELAAAAEHVVALDFMETSIAENKRLHGHHGNIDFRVGDVTELKLEVGCCDVVFSNWLLMYLSDEEVQGLAANMLSWVTEGGTVFFRESCFRQSGDKARKNNPTHYRNPREYFHMFDGAQRQEADGRWSRFELAFCKCIDTYVHVKRNQNQICWRWTKVVCDRPREDAIEDNSMRHFLDHGQYSSKSILHYERIFGQGFMSSGGERSISELTALLNLQPGDRVLDVGCGIGGSTYAIASHSGVHCHGLDLSVNAILMALERASERPGADVTFEVADCTTREYAEASFDVVYSRDVLLYIEDQATLLKRFTRWLRPGGRLLLTDYCRSDAEPSADFKAYTEQRRYHLHTVEEYGELIQQAGFTDVKSEDRSEQFLGYLRSELAQFESGKEGFVREFSQKEYDSVVSNWRGKIERLVHGEQRWGLFQARKPAANSSK